MNFTRDRDFSAIERAEAKKAVFAACIDDGDAVGVTRCLDEGASADACFRGGPATYIASGRGHLDVVRVLLDRGGHLNCRDDRGLYNPLYNACSNGHLEVARELLDRGADPCIVWLNGCSCISPLGTAAGSNHVACVRLLLARGVHIDREDGPLDRTQLHMACLFPNLDMARVLLMHGADIFCEDNMGLTPLDLARQYASCRPHMGQYAPKRRATELNALFDSYLPAYWERLAALTFGRVPDAPLPMNRTAGDEDVVRHIGSFVVGDLLLRKKRSIVVYHRERVDQPTIDRGPGRPIDRGPGRAWGGVRAPSDDAFDDEAALALVVAAEAAERARVL
jgi:hypothetical protein